MTPTDVSRARAEAVSAANSFLALGAKYNRPVPIETTSTTDMAMRSGITPKL